MDTDTTHEREQSVEVHTSEGTFTYLSATGWRVDEDTSFLEVLKGERTIALFRSWVGVTTVNG